MRVVFMGTPLFAIPSLQGIYENYELVGLVTQPDKHNSNSFVKDFAIKNNILLLQPIDIKSEYFEIIKLKPDLIVTCAYGQIIPDEIIDYPKYGCINIHASLLPKLRGGAPIHKAIIEGYEKTGITIMYMNSKMDQGDIISQLEVDIDFNDNYTSLHNKMMYVAKNLVLSTIENIKSEKNNRTKQDHSIATYAWNIKREDEKINFDKSKLEVYNKIRGLSETPGAFCYYEGKICKVFKAKIGENHFMGINGEIGKVYNDGIGVKLNNGEIIFEEIQIEGKKRLKVSEFLNGIQNKESLIGKVLE